MIYYVREVAGWLLLLLGLLLFAYVYDFCERRAIFEAGILAVVGIFVFRGGIHLLKVAVAARICQQAQDRLYPAAPTGAGPKPTAVRDRVSSGRS
ncbi:MAG: hypothetical protein U0736_23995 [Gemmataceae bacterium]